MNSADRLDGLSADTLLSHLGRHPERHHQLVNTPVHRASTILFPTLADLDAADRGTYPGLIYGLRGTPSTHDLQDTVARIEGGHAALVVPSGLAAITVPLLALLAAGDHLLMVDSVYGPTRRFCDEDLRRFGVETTYYDPALGEGIAGLMRPNTKVVFCESPGSLTLEIQDVPAIARAAHAGGASVLMDNTWATGLYFPAFAHGVDVSIHAGTKYLAGHSDVLIGLVVCNAGIFPRLHSGWRNLGVTASPDDCFLTLRGVRTLSVRLERHQRSGIEVARWLETQPEVARVIHPALPGHPGHALWVRDFRGASGLFSFLLHPVGHDALGRMLDGMRLFGMGWSWGGFESLLVPVKPERLRTATRWDASLPVLRAHIGLEDPADLIADLRAGLDRLAG